MFRLRSEYRVLREDLREKRDYSHLYRDVDLKSANNDVAAVADEGSIDAVSTSVEPASACMCWLRDLIYNAVSKEMIDEAERVKQQELQRQRQMQESIIAKEGRLDAVRRCVYISYLDTSSIVWVISCMIILIQLNHLHFSTSRRRFLRT